MIMKEPINITLSKMAEEGLLEEIWDNETLEFKYRFFSVELGRML